MQRSKAKEAEQDWGITLPRECRGEQANAAGRKQYQKPNSRTPKSKKKSKSPETTESRSEPQPTAPKTRQLARATAESRSQASGSNAKKTTGTTQAKNEVPGAPRSRPRARAPQAEMRGLTPATAGSRSEARAAAAEVWKLGRRGDEGRRRKGNNIKATTVLMRPGKEGQCRLMRPGKDSVEQPRLYRFRDTCQAIRIKSDVATSRDQGAT